MLRHVRVLLVFLFKQNTAYEVRISDWSSDVCSSDLKRMGPRWSASLRQAMEKYRFAVHAGTTSETWLSGRMGASASGATAVTVDAYADGLKAVVDGRADAFFGDRPILLDMASRSPAAGDLILLPLQGDRKSTRL